MSRLLASKVREPPRVIVLSPHLDDAILSLGATIAQLRGAGMDVEVWTFFTRGPSPDRVPPDRRVFADYETRRIEDECALRHVGAKPRWWGFEERLFRSPALPHVSGVFRTPSNIDGFARLTELNDLLAQVLDPQKHLVFAPLGVGNHHDHVELALAAMRVMCARRAWHRFMFYEDFYALGAKLRRRHFVTRRKPWPAGRAPVWGSPLLALSLRMNSWSTRGPGVDAYLPEVAKLHWQATVVQGDIDAKLRALAEYRSQVVAFGGLRRLGRFVRCGYVAFGGELLWCGVPTSTEATSTEATSTEATSTEATSTETILTETVLSGLLG